MNAQPWKGSEVGGQRGRQRQHGFDVHFDCSFYDQAGNGRQLIAVRLLADEKSVGFARGGIFGGRGGGRGHAHSLPYRLSDFGLVLLSAF